MRRAIKIGIVNLSVFITVLALLELSSSLLVRSYYSFSVKNSLNTSINNHQQLLGVDNYHWIEKYVREFNAITAKYHSYIGWRRSFFKGETININREGIRKTFFVAENDSAKKVIFLGGSTIWEQEFQIR